MPNNLKGATIMATMVNVVEKCYGKNYWFREAKIVGLVTDTPLLYLISLLTPVTIRLYTIIHYLLQGVMNPMDRIR